MLVSLYGGAWYFKKHVQAILCNKLPRQFLGKADIKRGHCFERADIRIKRLIQKSHSICFVIRVVFRKFRLRYFMDVGNKGINSVMGHGTVHRHEFYLFRHVIKTAEIFFFFKAGFASLAVQRKVHKYQFCPRGCSNSAPKMFRISPPQKRQWRDQYKDDYKVMNPIIH